MEPRPRGSVSNPTSVELVDNADLLEYSEAPFSLTQLAVVIRTSVSETANQYTGKEQEGTWCSCVVLSRSFKQEMIATGTHLPPELQVFL